VVFVVLIERVNKNEQIRDVFAITFKNDMRVILWTFIALISSWIFRLANKQILNGRNKTILLIWLLRIRLDLRLNLRLFLRLDLRLGLRLRNAYSGYGRVFLWYLCLWKRWSVLQIEAVNFPNPMVCVRNVLLSPSGVSKAGVCISPKHFVCKLILNLV
jgi:hypothetical protein